MNLIDGMMKSTINKREFEEVGHARKGLRRDAVVHMYECKEAALGSWVAGCDVAVRSAAGTGQQSCWRCCCCGYRQRANRQVIVQY